MKRAFLDLLGFLTVLPAGMPERLEDVAGRMYLFPVVGGLLGLLAGFSTRLFTLFLPTTISSALGFFVLLSLTGFHHLDGLLDFGDALLFRGPMDRRIEVLHDTTTGVGGFAIGGFVTGIGVLAAYEFTSAAGNPVILFAAAETMAKTALVMAAGLGDPAFEGMGSVFTGVLKKSRWQPLAAAIIAGLLTAPAFGLKALILLATSFFSALFFVLASKRLIGGVSGDVFGALNETTRTLSMLVMLWMLS
ncbi:MAG: adenosylcobinamide-GDP ribazoletransferase [Methanobacteriota archaeon]|nr:MAG: adenosylcobinamide-GDP ribazoletransferase [Euryarchaeota archaeon]